MYVQFTSCVQGDLLFPLKSILNQGNFLIFPGFAILKARESRISLFANFCQRQVTGLLKDSTTGGKLPKNWQTRSPGWCCCSQQIFIKDRSSTGASQRARKWILAWSTSAYYWCHCFCKYTKTGFTWTWPNYWFFHNGNFLGIIEPLSKYDPVTKLVKKIKGLNTKYSKMQKDPSWNRYICIINEQTNNFVPNPYDL